MTTPERPEHRAARQRTDTEDAALAGMSAAAWDAATEQARQDGQRLRGADLEESRHELLQRMRENAQRALAEQRRRRGELPL